MRGIAFFGHHAGDAAIRRRVHAFQQAGMQVDGFMMRRTAIGALDWNNVDLGETADADFVGRLRAIGTGARRAARHRDTLRRAQLFYARNLDMLACAFLARRLARLDTPVVYECLDVHRMLTRRDPIGHALRRLEGQLLARCTLLVVSSPAFLREYFAHRHEGGYRPYLLENRLVASMAFASRPDRCSVPSAAEPLRIGWFGNLRCARSMRLFRSLAARFGGRVVFDLRGYPFEQALPRFDADVSGDPSIRYGGRYRAPDDLATLYGNVDLAWGGDWFEAGFNSRWLLPNRLYEGGYFGTPLLAPEDSETGRWVATRNAGFTFAEPIEETVPRLLERLLGDRDAIRQRRDALLALPLETFVEPRDEMRRVVETALDGARA